MDESHLRKKKYPSGFETWTDRVVGVTFENEDGSDRQSILDDLYMYNNGDFELWVPEIEYFQFEGKHAYRVISEYGVIGNLAQETANQLAKLDNAGYIITVQGGVVFGGPTDDEPDRKYGCRIDLGISSPEFQKKQFEEYMKQQNQQEKTSGSKAKDDLKKALSEMAKDQTVHIVVDDNISEKKKNTALALCFFLGVFGVHRFYVGKIISGVIMGGYGLIWAFLVFVEGVGFVKGGANLLIALMPILWGIDMIRLATNHFPDYYGRKLS